MSEPDIKQQESTSIEFVEPENGMLITYANNIAYGFTPGDMRMVFGELIDFEDGKATVEQRVQITTSWLQAKVLGTVLMALVANHEAEYGSLKVPPNMIPFQKP